jgi:hypothetical protein
MSNEPDWTQLLQQARQERAALWGAIIAETKQAGHDLPENCEEIGALYADLRIDFIRAQEAVNAGGSLEGIEIDPRPEDAPEGSFTILDAYFVHFRRVIDETIKHNGLTEIDLSSKEHSDLFDETEIRLFEAHESINPLL